MTRISLHDSVEDAAGWLAEAVSRRLGDALCAEGKAWLAVSGGQSPAPVYDRLSAAPLDWRHVTVSLVDERLVPRSHADRNETMIRRTLLKGDAAEAQWSDIADDEGAPEASLALATRQLARQSTPATVMILGMGMDGHTLSWFPGAPETPGLMLASGPSVGLCTPTEAPWQRITLGWRAVASCPHVFLWLGSAEKTRRFESLQMSASGIYPVVSLAKSLGDTLTVVGVSPHPGH